MIPTFPPLLHFFLFLLLDTVFFKQAMATAVDYELMWCSVSGGSIVRLAIDSI
jgi:hypothetical protein